MKISIYNTRIRIRDLKQFNHLANLQIHQNGGLK